LGKTGKTRKLGKTFMTKKLDLFKEIKITQIKLVAKPKILELRKFNNISLRELEKKLELSRTRLNQIEKGSYCSAEEATRIQKFFNSLKKN